MARKEITTNDLALMIGKGFAGVDRRFNEMATKVELEGFKKDINARFDKLEKLILADHKKRIEKLEDEVKELKGTLALILK